MTAFEVVQVIGIGVAALVTLGGVVWAVARMLLRPNDQVAGQLALLAEKLEAADNNNNLRRRELWDRVRQVDEKVDSNDRDQTKALHHYQLQAKDAFVGKHDLSKLETKVDELQRSESKNSTLLAKVAASLDALQGQLSSIEKRLQS